jgi:predicted nucleotidyltransferase
MRANTGIFASEQEALDGLVQRLVSALDPMAIWLFGSRARGTHRPDSDFDLVVVAKPGAAWAEDFDAVYLPTMGTGLSRDIVPYDSEVFEAACGLATSFARRVVEEGRRVYPQ